MPGFTITGGVTFDSGFRFSAEPEPISATAGSVTSVSGFTNAAITSFFPFASVQNGVQPYTYFVSAGVLPTGITINSSTGLVSGTPTVAQGASNVTFTVRDSNNVLASTTSIVSFQITALTYTIQYLVVAGGGAGGRATNFTSALTGGGGGGGVLAGSFNLVSPGTPLTITVGGGGTVGAGTSPNNPGSSSNITSPAFSTVTTVGGGGGGFSGSAAGPTSGAQPGGSGAGAQTGSTAAPITLGPNVAGTGTAGQGNPGGGGAPNQNAAGGGGGAGASGTSFTPTQSGPGGAGVIWPFTGPGVFYGGGGGGAGSAFSGIFRGSGGPGGGGIGGNAGNGACGISASPGTPGLGGGGGGGAAAGPGVPGTGGSGVVILAVPTLRYPGVAPGAAVSNPPAAPGQTVLTYTTPNPATPATFTYTA